MSLTVTPGDSNDYEVVVTDQAGLPYNLTGATLTFTVRDSWEAPDPARLVKTSPATGITITDAPGGEAAITLDPGDTDDWGEDDRFVWDLQVRTNSGKVYTVARGVALSQMAATRTT